MRGGSRGSSSRRGGGWRGARRPRRGRGCRASAPPAAARGTPTGSWRRARSRTSRRAWLRPYKNIFDLLQFVLAANGQSTCIRWGRWSPCRCWGSCRRRWGSSRSRTSRTPARRGRPRCWYCSWSSPSHRQLTLSLTVSVAIQISCMILRPVSLSRVTCHVSLMSRGCRDHWSLWSSRPIVRDGAQLTTDRPLTNCFLGIPGVWSGVNIRMIMGPPPPHRWSCDVGWWWWWGCCSVSTIVTIVTLLRAAPILL